MFEEVYARNSVVHMLTEKEYAWALRAHILVHGALSILLLQMIKQENGSCFTSLEQYYEKVILQDFGAEEADSMYSSPDFKPQKCWMNFLKS